MHDRQAWGNDFCKPARVSSYRGPVVHTVEITEFYSHSAVWKNETFTAMQDFFRQISLDWNVETLIWRNFCEKIVAVKFCNFHSVSVVKWKIYSHWKNISSNHLFSNHVAFTKSLPKIRESKYPKLPHSGILTKIMVKWEKGS